jgi:hypothetical protein
MWSVQVTRHMRCTLWSVQVYSTHEMDSVVCVQVYSTHDVSSVVCVQVYSTHEVSSVVCVQVYSTCCYLLLGKISHGLAST